VEHSAVMEPAGESSEAYQKVVASRRADLHFLRVADLKQLLGQYRLSKTGVKNDLISRLMDYVDLLHR
jgi:hypothetical protein